VFIFFLQIPIRLACLDLQGRRSGRLFQVVVVPSSRQAGYDRECNILTI